MERLKIINSILFFFIAVSVVIRFGSSFFLPFIFGIFLASLMTPFSDLLEKMWNNRIFSSFLSTLVVFIVVGGLLYLFTYQMRQFVKDMPALIKKLVSFIEVIQSRIASSTGLSLAEQKNLILQRSDSFIQAAESYMTSFLSNIINTFIRFLLTLLYIFLFLLYRTKFTRFIMMYVNDEKKNEAGIVVKKISKVVYQYLWGRAKVMTMLGIMYYITFLIFGLPYALLLTIFGALVTIVPYVGPFFSTIFPIFFAILYVEGSLNLALFIILISIIQLIESYVLEPLIIGKEVRLNPLVVIIAILMGNMAWGLAGMILFVPIFAIIKIISNHSKGLTPVGYLFGNAKE